MDPPTTAPPAPSALEHSFLEGAESNEDLSFEADPEALPYRLQAVGHSLGAACLLMYAVACRRQGLPHRLSRLVLLSPAGFHPRIPLALRLFKWMFPVVCWVLRKVRPSMGVGLRLPSPALRWVTFKLMADLQRSPALMDLFKAGISVATSGDTSHWHAAMALPHYSPQAMPAISLHTTNHFAQWARHPEFRMYDYGTAAANMEHYGSTVPPSIAQNYSLLSDLPVDLAAGTSDGLIAPENVEQHARWLTKAGVRCTLRYFSYGHLQFTFGVKEEVVSYVLSRLRQSTCGALAVNGSSLGKA